MTPEWWSRRDRLAARLGRHFWPAWYIAPRATRERWAAFAAAMDAKSAELDVLEAVELLERHGLRVGPARPLLP